MSMRQTQIAPPLHGVKIYNIGDEEIRSWASGEFFQECADEVVGANAADGTAIVTHAIPDGSVATLTKFTSASKEGTVTTGNVVLVLSTANGVGGAETQLATHFHPTGVNYAQSYSNSNGPLVAIANNTGATLYFVVYAPHTSGGAATNDAATQYYSASIAGTISTA